MNRPKKGFTLVEVALVVALTGLVLAGLISGISFNLAHQRYSESVQDYAEFLRRVYSEAANVENSLDTITANQNYCTAPMLGAASGTISFDGTGDTGGRSNCAFYGKLISFGETSDPDDIYVYDVIGQVYHVNDAVSSDIPDALASLNSDILTVVPNGSFCTIRPFETAYHYYPQYHAEIQNTSGGNFTGMVLIARSPATNSLHTFYSTESLKNAYNLRRTGSCRRTLYRNYSNVQNASLNPKLSTFSGDNDINFCVSSDDVFATGNTRRNVRIVADGHDASAVRLINTDALDAGDPTEGSQC